MEEFELARTAGAFLLPIGAFGGAAQEISRELLGSATPATGPEAVRPSDDELRVLSNGAATDDELLATVRAILDRRAKAG
jgi:hypothetical protein